MKYALAALIAFLPSLVFVSMFGGPRMATVVLPVSAVAAWLHLRDRREIRRPERPGAERTG